MTALHIHHSVHGPASGPPIVLVHGWGLDARRNWVDTGWVDALVADGRRAVLLDVRGHGRSDKPLVEAAYRYGAMADDVVQVMDELELATADYLGYSLGAFVGAALLGSPQEGRSRFRSMVLGGIGEETAESSAACEPIAAALRADDASAITDPLGRAYRAFVDLDPTSDREALAVAALGMWPDGHPLELGGDGLRRAEVPVLVVNGSEDRPYIDTVQPFVDALRHSELVVIDGTDHLTTVSDPRFKAVTMEFLGRVPD
jgi:pimeloyl-ACP methyl ester carboxylesterase